MIGPSCSDNRSPCFSLLSKDQIDRIHCATLHVLERTGVVFQHEKALEILGSIGCSVEKDLVKIPSHLVEEAIRVTPSSVRVYNRDASPRMTLEGRNVYYGAGLTSPTLVEIDGTRKPYTREQCVKNTIVADALENIDFTMSLAHVTDVAVSIRDVVEVYTVLRNSTKPIIITSHTAESLGTIVEMCGIISSSKEEFLRKPSLMYYTEPVSPLRHTTHSLEKVFRACDYGLPLLNTPAPMAGGTAPITLTGTLLTGFAELLSGLVLIQNYRKGTPIIFGGVFTAFDMKSMIFTYGSPELQLMNTAIAQMAQHYKIPSFGTAGVTDSHELDEQAAFECGMSILLNELSGSNLVHDVGFMSSSMGTSNELLMLADEMIGWTKRYMCGIGVDTLGDSIRELTEVGPGGNFLERDLTLNRFKQEVWYPTMMSRIAYKAWDASDKTPLKERLRNKVEILAQTHTPLPISDDKIQEIDRLIATCDA